MNCILKIKKKSQQFLKDLNKQKRKTELLNWI